MNNSFINFILIIFAVFGFVGGLYGASLLVLSSLFFILIILLARFWNYRAFSRLEINKSLSRNRVEFEEKLFYSIELENKKVLPLLWLKFEEFVDEKIDFTADKLIHNSIGRKSNILRDSISLKWFEKVRRNYEIIPRQRGLFEFGKGNILFNGILGLYQNKKEVAFSQELIVYPKIVPVNFPNIKESYIFGTTPKEGWIYKDRLNKVGVRPYQPTDSSKDINWKASARHIQLESNIYNPSFNKELHIFLNSTNSRFWRGSGVRENLELAIITAASLVDKYLRSELSIGFYSNLMGVKGYNRNYIEIDADNNTGQRRRIMTSLALIQPYQIKDVSYLIQKKQKELKNGATVVMIIAGVSDKLKKLLYDYNRNFNLIVIRLNRKEKVEKLRGIKELFIEEGGNWNEIESLELVQ